ncbi:thioredoxin domain-containing protein, partial [Candidatus Peregrinibacteria bacterium]|nr:thioredoxin domain-containing protein [Candidatus Peregrinibacteria bacterium]
MNKGVFLAVLFGTAVIAGSLVFLGMRTCEDNLSKDDIKAAVIEGLNDYIKTAPQPEPVADDSEDDLAENHDKGLDYNFEGPVMGDENAPVTIVEFSEFQCPYCLSYYNDTYGKIKDNYVETGKVKYIFKHFPLGFHEGAYPAALASECAYAQGGDDLFYEMHDKIFENSSILHEEEGKIFEGIAELAEEIGLNMETY